MTQQLFLQDAYLREAEATVIGESDGGIILDRSIFYARGGGQPGDTGTVRKSRFAFVPSARVDLRQTIRHAAIVRYCGERRY